jgi:hypothetical protein
MPEARRFKEVVGIGRTPGEVLARLEEAVTPPARSAAAVEARMRAVEPYSWDRLFRQVESILATHLAAPAAAPAGRA